MHSIIFIAEEKKDSKDIRSQLRQRGYSVTLLTYDEFLNKGQSLERADFLLFKIPESNLDTQRLLTFIKDDSFLKDLPLVIMMNEDSLKGFDLRYSIDDFLILPCTISEIEFRLRLALWRHNRIDIVEGLRFEDLVMDFSKYEVRLKGKSVDLTYKEYELLKFLATNPGKVFTREALLDKVWGYNFYGGTRTVDVHIRRLRSKIEDETHIYIETIHNVGYKFIEPKTPSK